jgi:hypothetical protein
MGFADGIWAFSFILVPYTALSIQEFKKEETGARILEPGGRW